MVRRWGITYLSPVLLVAVAAVEVCPDGSQRRLYHASGDAGRAAWEKPGAQYAAPEATPAPRANTVKHTGAKASPEAVKLLHTLRGKVGGLVVCDPKEPCPYKNGKLCAYHTQLAAFKDTDGNPVKSSKDLSPEQISNLISRYEKKINEQSQRAAQPVDISPLGRDSRRSRAIADALKSCEMDASDLCGIFSVDDITQLDDEQAGGRPPAWSLVRNPAIRTRSVRDSEPRLNPNLSVVSVRRDFRSPNNFSCVVKRSRATKFGRPPMNFERSSLRAVSPATGGRTFACSVCAGANEKRVSSERQKGSTMRVTSNVVRFGTERSEVRILSPRQRFSSGQARRRGLPRLHGASRAVVAMFGAAFRAVRS